MNKVRITLQDHIARAKEGKYKIQRSMYPSNWCRICSKEITQGEHYYAGPGSCFQGHINCVNDRNRMQMVDEYGDTQPLTEIEQLKLTPEDLDALEKLEKEATPGEWKPFIQGGGYLVDAPATYNWIARLFHPKAMPGLTSRAPEPEQVAANVELIANMRNALPALLAAARREGELREIVGKLMDDAAHSRSCEVNFNPKPCTCGLVELREKARALGVEI